MDYITAWEQMREQSRKRAEAKDYPLVHTMNSRAFHEIHYYINVFHPSVIKRWEKWKEYWKTTPESYKGDERRYEFEKRFIKSKLYYKIVKQEIDHFGIEYYTVMLGSARISEIVDVNTYAHEIYQKATKEAG